MAENSQNKISNVWVATPTVSAQLAYDCLNSVPLGATEATDLVNSLLPYVEWQSGEVDARFENLFESLQDSDISYLKNPPEGYQEPAVDLWVRFDDILENIKSGKYANEYEFQVELYKTFNEAHDGHFRFAPDLLSKAVGFRRPTQLVSVSRDGTELPKIYIRGELLTNVIATISS